MERQFSTEELEHISAGEQTEEREHYTPRPKYQIVLAWILAIIVIIAFLGTCYWLAFFKI